MTYQGAVDTYINGNRSEFKAWVKRASKLNILNAIEYYAGHYGQRHELINTMRIYLEEKL